MILQDFREFRASFLDAIAGVVQKVLVPLLIQVIENDLVDGLVLHTISGWLE